MLAHGISGLDLQLLPDLSSAVLVAVAVIVVAYFLAEAIRKRPNDL